MAGHFFIPRLSVGSCAAAGAGVKKAVTITQVDLSREIKKKIFISYFAQKKCEVVFAADAVAAICAVYGWLCCHALIFGIFSTQF
ncbi:MAG: hypothetical protein HYZ65_07590 [Burkholderiales bacterium]|nr:hypothetical protein [Burkholderiales bacterium]